MSLKRKRNETDPNYPWGTTSAELEAQKIYPIVRSVGNETTLIREDLKEKGYSVVQILTEEEVKESMDLFWQFLTGLGTGLDRNNKKTWKVKTTWPDQIHGIIKSYGIGQSELLWRARTHPKVLALFRFLWGPHLITSFDGAGFYPQHPDFVSTKTYNPWYHRDQSPKRNGLECIQGVLQLTDTTRKGSGGFLCFPQSHKVNFTTLYEDATTTKNWWKLPYATEQFNSHTAKVIGAPAGAIVIWDSRLIHANCPPTLKPRAVIYLCMKPATISLALQKKRVKYFNTNRTTSHWPDKVSVNSDSKRFRSTNEVDPKPIVAASKPFKFENELASLQRALVAPNKEAWKKKLHLISKKLK